MLRGTAELIKENDPTSIKIKSEIEKTLLQISQLEGKVDVIESNALQNITNQIASENGMSETQKEELLKRLTSIQQNTNLFMTNFGSLIHARNAYLNVAGHIIEKTTTQSDLGFLSQTKPFISKIKDIANLKRFTKDGYLENAHNRKVMEEDLLSAKWNIYNSLENSEIDGEKLAEEAFRKDSGKSVKLTVDGATNYREQVKKWRQLNISENAFSLEEIEKREKKYDELNLPKEVLQYEKLVGSRYAEINQNAEKINGITVFDSDMKADLEQVKKERTNRKSIYESGKLKDGLELTEELEDGAVKAGSVFIRLKPNAGIDAVFAYSLNKLDNFKIEEFKKNGKKESVITDSFREIFNTLEPREAIEFLNNNTYVGFTDEYYEDIKNKDSETLIERLEKVEDTEALIADIKEASNIINNILKANRDANNPIEVNFENLSAEEIKTVNDYQNLLQTYYSEAYRYLKVEEVEKIVISETKNNKAFDKYWEDKFKSKNLDTLSNINEALEILKNHLTIKDSVAINDLFKVVASGNITGKEKIFKGDYEGLSSNELTQVLGAELVAYAKTRVMPYFKKSQPIGFEDVFEELTNGGISPEEFLENYENGDYKYLNITPNFNFQEASKDNEINQRFQENKKQNKPQYRIFEEGVTVEDLRGKSVDQLIKDGKLNKYVDVEYFKKYDIDLETLFTEYREVARKNKEDFQTKQDFLEYHTKTLDNYGVLGAHDLYLLPQMEATKLKKFKDFTKDKGVKQIIEEYINYREDENDRGEVRAGITVNTVPKYGLRKLAQSETTDEILESYTWMNQQSNLYKARVENIGDMLATKESLANTTFENGLEATATRTYKMFDEAMKYNFFGHKETFSKEFEVLGIKGDYGKVLSAAKNWISFRNMGWNITVPITSALTGSTQFRLESLIGERIDEEARGKANKFFAKNASGAMGELLGISSRNSLNVFGEYFGWADNQERYKNSAYSKLTRGALKSGYGLHEMANFPINFRVGMTVLYNHKFVDGELLDYRAFKRRSDNRGIKESDVRKKWKNYKELPELLEVKKDGTMEWNTSEIQKIEGFVDLDINKFMENRLIGVRSKVSLALQDIDQLIPDHQKSIIARHSMWNFFTIFRSWLTLTIQRKFKYRHYSLASQEYEEGSWMTIPRVVNNLIKDIRSGDVKDVMKHLKEKWETGDETTKLNIKRFAVEFGAMNLLIAGALMAIKELDDEDEDSYLFKIGAYFLFRTTNEIASSNTGLPKNIYGTLENTIVGLNSVEMITDIFDLTSSKEIKSGRYAGKTEAQRYLAKQLPIWKEYTNIVDDLDGNIKSYRFFNFEKAGNLDYSIYPILQEEK